MERRGEVSDWRGDRQLERRDKELSCRIRQRSSRLFPTPRGRSALRWKPKDSITRGPIEKEKTKSLDIEEGQRRCNSNHVNLREGYDEDAVLDVEKKGLDRWDLQGKRKSFRDLFTTKDNEASEWVEVRRRRQRRPPRPRSPIIKNPCFSCGLGGHIRRFCPRKRNMRCYGCNSPSHLIKDCMVVQRPEISKVELKSVYDITNRLRSLCKFAIFRPSGPVNASSLRLAMIERHWEGKWQGKIYPLEKASFLVEFQNESNRDYAVMAGKVNYGGFSGTFYEWNENWGAMKVFRPVIVWISLKGLPFQCWGEEEIKSIVETFGKLHKIDDNLYLKTRVDEVKAMVEVEDISLVPRVIQCSYKAVTDGKFRFYPINLLPSSVCLPVSQWNDDTYNSYAEEGGSGGFEEERWSSQATIQRRGDQRPAERTEEEDVGQGGMGAVNYDASFPPIIAPATVATFEEGASIQRVGSNARVDLVGEELERRRKGKGIYIPEVHGPRPMRPDRHVMPSGSDSCDPVPQREARVGSPVPTASADADSRAGPCTNKGNAMVNPIVLSDSSEKERVQGDDQDVDMGGEISTGRGAVIKLEDDMVREVTKRDVMNESKGKEVVGANKGAPSDQNAAGSKGSSVSVPPGFKKVSCPKAKHLAGVSSPFGKLQKGGFKFLKRSASSSTSGLKPDPASKKTRPLASMQDKDIVDLASDVGISKPLSQEQLSRMRNAEKDRASS